MENKIILKSKNIFTGTSNKLLAGAVVVSDNKIEYVGAGDVDRFIEKETIIYDYGEKVIIPGIHDSHLHFYWSSLLNSGKVVLLFDAQSEEEAVQLLKKAADKEKDKSKWILAFGWYHTLWDNKTLPTKKSLDKAFPDRPVYADSADGHNIWINSVGLEKLGITKESISPEGGTYGRFEDGELNGILAEMAGMEQNAKVFTLPFEESKIAVEDCMKVIKQYGITSVSDLSLLAVPGGDMIADTVYQGLLEEGKSTVRIHMYPTLTKDKTRVQEMKTKYQHPMLQFSGLKQFFDGVSSTHTAYLSEPYSNASFEDDKGRLTIQKEEMKQLVFSAIEDNHSVRIHTIGDEAITTALDIFEEAEAVYGKQPHLQHCLEHLENLKDEDIDRLRQLNIIASVQPAHSMVDPEGIEADLGQKRIKCMWPFRSFLSRGVTMSFGTDSPVSDLNPFETIYNATARKKIDGTPKNGWQEQESIDVADALRAYTMGSAKTARRQEELGTLTKGKLADLAVLDTNIFECPLEDIIQTKAEMTMVDGKIVYQK